MTPRSHNVTSYTGALVVVPAVLLLRTPGGVSTLPPVTLLAALLWCFHFTRRALESALLHRYSRPTMPTADVVIEYVYYWGFGAWIGESLATGDAPTLDAVVATGLGLFVLAQLGNHLAHRKLAALRPEGGDARPIVRGGLFEWVSSPHYLFEITTWVGFALVTQRLASLSFAVVGACILAAWAHQRHSAYRTRYDGTTGEAYPAKRRALVPWVF